MDEKHPIAFAKVEIIEADGMKPGDLCGRSQYMFVLTMLSLQVLRDNFFY